MEVGNIKCVLLADRHLGLTESVCGLLGTEFDTVVMVSDEYSLQESAVRLQPTVAVVDISLTRGKGFKWVQHLRGSCPNLKLILLSLYDEMSVCRSAMAGGVDGFVLKRAIETQLLDAVKEVLAGRRYVPPEMAQEFSPPGKVRGIKD